MDASSTPLAHVLDGVVTGRGTALAIPIALEHRGWNLVHDVIEDGDHHETWESPDRAALVTITIKGRS